MRESLYEYCLREDRKNLLEQWDSTGNAPLTPTSVSYGSKQKVWWQCDKGHRWQAAVYTRTGSGTGCPVCAGKVPQIGESDLATLYPDLAGQWHPSRNHGLTPFQVSPAATGWSGGSVSRATSGGLRSVPGWRGVAVRFACTE